MRTLLKWSIRTLLALLLAALLALAAATDGAPRLAPRDDVSPADVDRAVAMAKANDPRLAPPGQLRRVLLSERDVDLLLYQAAHRFVAARTRVQLRGGRLLVQASLAAPLGRWLNLELGLRQGAVLPEVDRLRIGHLPLPAALAAPLLRAIVARHGVREQARAALQMVEHVTLAPGRMVVTYRFDLGSAHGLRMALVTPADEERLRAYDARLAQVTLALAGEQVSLARLLPPLLALAAERTAAGGDAVGENRAALLVLTFFANHRPLALIVPAATSWPQPRPLVVTLRQRSDTPLHFLISALIAAEADTPLADAVGLWKELSDARHGGSGFSFNDLAADRAGTRLGELAVREPAQLQSRLAASTREDDFMPDARDLPESLPEAEFVARYGGVGGAAYQRTLADIEARLAALPLFR
jgi:hypothetical protein